MVKVGKSSVTLARKENIMVSRVAKNPIKIPSGVDVKVHGRFVTVKGKFGELTQIMHDVIKVTQEGNKLRIMSENDLPKSNALVGTTHAVIQNIVHGVHKGFQRRLVIVGVGYRAKAQGKTLNLTIGFSHPVEIEIPESITVETPSTTEIIVKGANRQLVCQVAANIRATRPPEPYKGKGIRYDDENVVRKEAKKK